ncbi:MAG: recombination protein RecR [Parachlamydiaceae bacterium]|nr:recombination protein RecR [Parachlamydiaceae bacterium]
MKYPLQVIKLIEVLKKLPGVGSKSAERFAFQMILWKKSDLSSMAEIISATADKLRLCSTCGCLADETHCRFCEESRAASRAICVIASLRDAYIIEETKEFKGFYHVIGGLLSPIDGHGPERLEIEKLRKRIIASKIQELVIALDSTLEGDATALFLKSALSDLPIKISRLAFGMPLGSSLDYVDGGTLARAFSARSAY